MSKLTLVLASIALAASATAASAQQASSSAYGLSANENVSAAGIVTATVGIGPVAQASGTAPPSYSDSSTVLTLSDSAALTSGLLGVTQTLGTGVLTSTATGTSMDAQATATVNNLGLSLGISPLISSLLGLNATTIQSSSQANSIGGLDASGSTIIEGLTLSGSLLSGLTIDGSLFVNPNPNTVLLSIAGLTIILNEQTMLGDGITTTGISTNAIDIVLNNFPLGTGVANGNIIVGHSQAIAAVGPTAAVPEPATWATMLLGFLGIGFAMRRRKAARNLQLA